MCILLVEDEFLTREVMQMVLEDAGFDVLAAASGEEACDCIQGFPDRFSGLVTDYRMLGRLTGEHVIQFMRPLYPRIPMILATAYVMPVTDNWLAQHSIQLLSKPFEADELVGRLRQLLH